jgi:nicotinamide-nucleotide amidase
MNDPLANLIQEHCIAQGRSLSLAESCTGGYLAARLTRLPGCSRYFLGSIVAYSNALKTNLLGVDAALLAQWGAVSAPVVRQMAEGVLRLTGSHYSLAVSGIAGPGGGSLQKPVGTIWGAIAREGKDSFVWDFFLTGTRQEIIEQSTEILLAQLWTLIKTEKEFMNKKLNN